LSQIGTLHDRDFFGGSHSHGVHVEQPFHSKRAVGWAAPERCQYQILADANFIGRIDQEIVRYLFKEAIACLHPYVAPRCEVHFFADCPP
jgi:hypothetical protein